MGQALYRKYRSKSLSEIVGQEHITDTLTKAIKSGRISHAYLFTGPRGVGKTSIARILAHEINGLPYDGEDAHLDIIEIDAASNRGIEDIRDLREKVNVVPSSGKYKVYIIDEVHMLTTPAFNALLKTLEEPPAHIVFILATTDTHKLPETIVSRTQRFTFKPIEKSKVVKHLQHIADEEKIKISRKALEMLAEHGEGSFRDSISLLDQASSHGKTIEVEDIETLLGIPSVRSVTGLIGALESGNTTVLMQTLNSLYEQGFQAGSIAKQVAASLREQLTGNTFSLDAAKILDILGKLIEVPTSHDPERYLEIVLLKSISPVTSPVRKAAPATVASPIQAAPSKQPDPKPVDVTPEVVDDIPAEDVIDVPKEAEPVPPQPTARGSSLDMSIWPEVLAALKKKHNTVYSIARMGQPTIAPDGALELAFAFAFHQKRINDAKNRKLLSDTINELTGQVITIRCVFNKELAQQPTPPEKAAEAKSDPALSTISNIFGGGELLES